MSSALITNSYYIQGRIDGEQGLPFGLSQNIELLQQQCPEDFSYYCKGYGSMKASIDYNKRIISPISNWPEDAQTEYTKIYEALEFMDTK
jgi:hypothetical protein